MLNIFQFDILVPQTVKYDMDTLSGGRIFTKNTIKFSNKLYDADKFAEYLSTTKDFREIDSQRYLSDGEIHNLIDIINDDTTKEILLNYELYPKLLKPTSIVASEYFHEKADLIVTQLLTSCELETLTTPQELQEQFDLLWIKLVDSLIGCLTHNPLSVVNLTVKLRSIISEAYNACSDETLYIHEETYLQPILVSTFSLFTLFCTGLMKYDSQEQFVNAAYILKPGKIP